MLLTIIKRRFSKKKKKKVIGNNDRNYRLRILLYNTRNLYLSVFKTIVNYNRK